MCTLKTHWPNQVLYCNQTEEDSRFCFSALRAHFGTCLGTGQPRAVRLSAKAFHASGPSDCNSWISCVGCSLGFRLGHCCSLSDSLGKVLVGELVQRALHLLEFFGYSAQESMGTQGSCGWAPFWGLKNGTCLRPHAGALNVNASFTQVYPRLICAQARCFLKCLFLGKRHEKEKGRQAPEHETEPNGAIVYRFFF